MIQWSPDTLWMLASGLCMSRLPEGKHNAAYGFEARDILWSIYRAAGGKRDNDGCLTNKWQNDAVREHPEADAAVAFLELFLPSVASHMVSLRSEFEDIDWSKVNRIIEQDKPQKCDVNKLEQGVLPL